MDVLLAGKWTLPLFERVAYRVVSSDVRQIFYSGLMSNTIPGSVENCSASTRNRCSASHRNPVRLQPGILFAFTPESCSAWTGIARLGSLVAAIAIINRSLGTRELIIQIGHVNS